MREQGARPAGLIAKIAGGARMFGAPSGMLDIGQQNVVAVRECLAQEGIRLVARIQVRITAGPYYFTQKTEGWK